MFEFRINISTDWYECKKYAQAAMRSAKLAKELGKAKMAFNEQTISIKQFIDYITGGYTFCGLFDVPDHKVWVKNGNYWQLTYLKYQRGVNKGAMKTQCKCDERYIGTQVVFVDIDETKAESMYDFIDKLTYKPTIGYYSYSDSEEKRKFRIVYIFDNILNKNEFRYIANRLHKQIEIDTDEPIADNCGERMSQYFNGNYRNTDIYNSNIIYNLDEIKNDDEIEDVETAISSIVRDIPAIDNIMVSDMKRMSVKQFMHKYGKKYNYIYRVEDEWTEYRKIQYTGENYLSLFWNVNRLKDGEHRRKKLFDRAALRRLMNNDIDINELLFNLYKDRDRFIDNSDNVITVDVLVNKVCAAFRYSIDELKVKYSKTIEWYKNNRPERIFRKGMNNYERGQAIKEENDAIIGNLYDVNKTVKENLVEINKVYKVGKTRLYKFIKEHNITIKNGNYVPIIRCKRNEQI